MSSSRAIQGNGGGRASSPGCNQGCNPRSYQAVQRLVLVAQHDHDVSPGEVELGGVVSRGHPTPLGNTSGGIEPSERHRAQLPVNTTPP
jgi:hypothetical protein